MTSTAAPGTQTPASPPLLEATRTQRSADRVLLGVAGGFAQRWHVDPTLLRAALGLLTLAGGIGIALYGVGVLLSEPRPTVTSEPAPPVAAPERRRNLAVVVATCATLLAAREVDLWPGDGVIIAAGVVAIAVTVLWSPTPTDARGGRIRGLAMVPAVRLLLGAILAVAGIAALTRRTGGLTEVGRSVSAIAIALGGIAVIAAPALGRLLGRLDTERTLRIREEERAALAAHLHDSVLQSLVLIQRSDDPRRMVSLARRQERELRSWLYGGRPVGQAASLTVAVETMAMAIEVDHEVRVEVVTVGDSPLDEAETTFLAALREATTNAVCHSNAEKVDVYVEVGDDVLTGFVRDTGSGFDPAGVPDDRHGIADSIIARIERAGGRATVTSRPGEGTEVEIELPWRRIPRERAGEMSEQAIKLVIIDDHELIRAGVRAELTGPDAATEPAIDVVGEAGSVEDAVEVIRRTRPDVVLLDVHLPGGGGRAVIEGIAADKLPSRFLALSVSDAADDVIGVVRAGARGYVTKSISAADLQAAIGRVHGGDAVFSPRLAGFVLDAFAGDETVKGAATASDPDLDRLTTREREVMRLIARGYSYKEIASRLFLSVKTVETHVSAVLRKLQLSNRHQLTAWANERRLV